MKDIFSIKYIVPILFLCLYFLLFNHQLIIEEIGGYILFFYLLIRLIYNNSYDITIKEILLILLILQYFIAPSVVYNKFNNDVGDFGYEMKIDKEAYFSFLLNNIIAFFIGLYIPIFNTQIDTPQIFNKIKTLNNNFKIGINLIIISFLSHLILPFLPSALAFLGTFLINIKYVGMFYVYYSNHKFKNIYVFLVIMYLVLNIISGGVFIDLFVWGLFMATYFTINKPINLFLKISILLIGVFTALLVQTIKADYRSIIWQEENKEEIQEEQVFIDLTSAKLQNAATVFDDDNLKNFFSRINQGWILSNVLEHVPKNENYANGTIFFRELQGILLPRIIAPNKITASGKDVKEKFMKYTGRALYGNTTMNIGLIADGYINFGKQGCLIYMFFIGLFINFFIYKMFHLSNNYPTLLLWLPVLFFYVIRSGNDFYMIMNYLVKSTMILFVVIFLFKNIFYKPELAKS